MIRKNVTGQKIAVFAYDATTGGAKTGDAANITGSISLDGAATGAITDTNPTEIGGGWYAFDLSQAETNANLLTWYGESATGNVLVEGGAAFTSELDADLADGGRLDQLIDFIKAKTALTAAVFEEV